MSALKDVKVLDFSKFLPGPYCTWILGDLGADIIRVEHPRELAKQAKVFGWDGFRSKDARLRRARDVFARNKKSLMIDPGHEAARDTITRLIQWADVLVEDYRPGVMDRMGWGYQAAAKINPRLVYCSLTLCGQTGPYRDKPGHDPIALAMVGALSRIGEDPDAPQFPGVPVADLLTGSNAVIGILAALHSGKGQQVDIAMSDASVALVGTAVARNPDLSKLPPRGARRADQGLWRCADGQWLCTTDMEPAYWARFCEAIGRRDFIPLQLDVSRREEIADTISGIMATRTRAEWVKVLETAQTQYMPVLDVFEAPADPHNQARAMFPTFTTEDGEEVRHIGAILKLTETPPQVRALGHAPGADTDEVLAMLGVDAEALKVSGALG